jgi:hypothetical protein
VAPPGDREWDYRVGRPERDGGRARRAQPGAAHSRGHGAVAEDSDHRGEAEEMRQSSQSQATRKRRKADSPPPDNLQSVSSDGGRDAASLSSSDGRALSSFLSEDQGASAEGNARFWSVNLRPPDSLSVSRVLSLRALSLHSVLSRARPLSRVPCLPLSRVSLSVSLSRPALLLCLSVSCSLARSPSLSLALALSLGTGSTSEDTSENASSNKNNASIQPSDRSSDEHTSDAGKLSEDEYQAGRKGGGGGGGGGLRRGRLRTCG